MKVHSCDLRPTAVKCLHSITTWVMTLLSSSSSRPPPSLTSIYFLSQWISLFWTLPINGIMYPWPCLPYLT